MSADLGGLAVGPGPFNQDAVAEPPPETTRLRVMHIPALCEAPAQVAKELLQAEGFSEVQYVWAPGAAAFQKTATGEIDLGLHFALLEHRSRIIP